MRNRLQPLNEAEKKFAEENHPFVYDFLKRHGYSIEEYYNIAIFGFLYAVQIYHRQKELLEKYPFEAIARQCMSSEINNYLRKKNTKKRKPLNPDLSLDAEYAEMENLHECIGKGSTEDEVLAAETMTELFLNVTDRQRKIIDMKLEGFNNKEVYLALEIKPSTYYKELQRIKAILYKLIG